VTTPPKFSNVLETLARFSLSRLLVWTTVLYWGKLGFMLGYCSTTNERKLHNILSSILVIPLTKMGFTYLLVRQPAENLYIWVKRPPKQA
jgi:hypothetical protein